jgi:ABC-type amino acid transport substrate-binding protein
MMAKKIAEKLGYELEIVKLDWESLIPALQSGDVDAVIAGQSITAKRLEQVTSQLPTIMLLLSLWLRKTDPMPRPPVYPAFRRQMHLSAGHYLV